VEFFSGNHTIEFNTSEETVYFEDNFNNLDNWTVNGPWEIIDELAWEGTALTDYWGENDPESFYAPNCDVSVISNSTFHIGNDEQKMLHFMDHLYVEPYFDFVTISLSNDQENWEEVYSNSEIRPEWKHQYISLHDIEEGDYYIRLRLQADSPHDALVDPGWTVDNLKIVGGDYEVLVNNETDNVDQFTNALLSNYPNPFNPETNLSFYLNPETKTADIKIYNIRGELVKTLPLNKENIKTGTIKWNADPFASGVYFYRLSADNKTIGTNKMILLK
jgi:hypothetical protein